MGFFDKLTQTIDNVLEANAGGTLADGKELYMDQKFSLRDTYDIVDAQTNPVYSVKGSLTGHSFQLKAASGEDVAEIKKKVMSMSPAYEISFANGQSVSLKKKVALVKVEFNGTVNGKALQIKGDVAADNFEVSVEGQKIGAVAKRFLAAHDAYVISFVDDSWKEVMVALTLTVDNACHKSNGDD